MFLCRQINVADYAMKRCNNTKFLFTNLELKVVAFGKLNSKLADIVYEFLYSFIFALFYTEFIFLNTLFF